MPQASMPKVRACPLVPQARYIYILFIILYIYIYIHMSILSEAISPTSVKGASDPVVGTNVVGNKVTLVGRTLAFARTCTLDHPDNYTNTR